MAVLSKSKPAGALNSCYCDSLDCLIGGFGDKFGPVVVGSC